MRCTAALSSLCGLLLFPLSTLAVDPFDTDDVTRLTGPTFLEAISDGRIHFIK
ncbi:hypothetical protein DUNSADRAFT_7812 [Dunaliella salina]|uniref:Uncharacterized protein n=1 Tax=Dunaliella salina TaxID=3046 RepID=A0ABQ7FT46_DUNSA|nr:hypothetical protein DUNSADRAFT_7812 [Dunaliella salina]|eukprot:KAF5825652.1 hypothetical protein DUNSADRAFT_7812 [Dunaliella salina]